MHRRIKNKHRTLSKVEVSEIYRNEQEAKRAKFERLFYRPLSIIGIWSIAIIAIFKFIDYEKPNNQLEIWNKRFDRIQKKKELLSKIDEVKDSYLRKEVISLLGMDPWDSITRLKENIDLHHFEPINTSNLLNIGYFDHPLLTNKNITIKPIVVHGPIEEMDTIYQFSPLTMGWNIDSYRESDLEKKLIENYEELLRLLKKNKK